MEKASIKLKTFRKLTDLSVGAGVGSDRGWKRLRFQLKTFRKLTDLSVGAGQERPGMEKALILIEILWKTNGFNVGGGGESDQGCKKLRFD